MKVQIEHERRSGQVYYTQHLYKLKSELWNDSILVNWLQSQYTVRIKGYASTSWYSNFIRLSKTNERNQNRLNNYLMLELLK